MPIAASLLMMTTLAVQNPQAPQRPEPAPPPAPTATQGASGNSTPTDRPHEFGVGGWVGISSAGGGGTFRYFLSDRLGIDMNAGMSRRTVAGTTRTSFQV